MEVDLRNFNSEFTINLRFISSIENLARFFILMPDFIINFVQLIFHRDNSAMENEIYLSNRYKSFEFGIRNYRHLHFDFPNRLLS